MKEILTEDLLAELLLSRDPQEFIEKYDITSHSLSEYLQALLEEKGLRRIDVIRSADLNETFGYQIFMGQRKPSRNKILQIAFAMGCTLKETNRLLQIGGRTRSTARIAAMPSSYSALKSTIRSRK